MRVRSNPTSEQPARAAPVALSEIQATLTGGSDAKRGNEDLGTTEENEANPEENEPAIRRSSSQLAKEALWSTVAALDGRAKTAQLVTKAHQHVRHTATYGNTEDKDGTCHCGRIICVFCFLPAFTFLVLWSISTLWGPSASESLYEFFFKCDKSTLPWDVYTCEDGNPWRVYPNGLRVLPYVCEEYKNKPIFGPLTPLDENEHGVRIQEIMKISLLYYGLSVPVSLFLKLIASSDWCKDEGWASGEHWLLNPLGALIFTAYSIAAAGLWFVQTMALDFNRNNETACTLMHTWENETIADFPLPTTLVAHTHLHDLSLTSTILWSLPVGTLFVTAFGIWLNQCDPEAEDW